MSRKQALKPTPPPVEQPHRRSYRVYMVAQLLSPEFLNMSQRTFSRLKHLGQLPFLVEIEPRAGRKVRYRADLVDRYLAGQWQQPRAFQGASHGRHLRVAASAPQFNSIATETR